MTTSMRVSAALAALLFAGLLSTPALHAQRPENVLVVNDTDRDVRVWVGGVPREVVSADTEVRLADVPEGAVTLMATDAATGEILATQHTSLAPGEAFTWTLYPIALVGEEKGAGTVVLDNRLDVAVEVTLAGNEVAVLTPGATRVLPRIVAGDAVARATEPGGSVVAEETLTILDGGIVRWEIGRN